MKRIVLIMFFIGLSIASYGQIISINDAVHPESSYGPEELIEKVLISSECTTVDSFSFQVSGNPTDTNTKSYGYFKKPTGSTFPFDEGIILTTGRAFPAGNTTNGTLVDNNNGFGGDIDLQNALGTFNTFDATFIKFNFVPIVDKMTFRFLMASEEYDGLTECNFADSFAFLLREVGTTTYTNLAVLPNGVTVSVRNINESSAINNPVGSVNCDANTTFFEGYNVADTNYGGRTKVITASAPVIPNTTYEIKLVVADQNDSDWDSAIFLEAGSFNIGGNLGPDRTIKGGNPTCGGKPFELDATLALPGTTYQWFKDDLELTGETNATYSPSVTGKYRVDIDVALGCNSSDEVFIEFTTNPIISSSPENIVLCETDNDLTEIFDFSGNESLVLGTQAASDFPVTFHTSQTDAESNLDPIRTPNAYSNTLQTETIWVRIADATQTCFEVASFDITVNKLPIANTPIDFELCDDSNDGDDTNGSVTFDLSTKINEVLGMQSAADFEVKFYASQPEAEAGVAGTEVIAPIPNTPNPQPIFARIETRANTSCYATTSFNLVVNPLPVINSIVELTQCDNDTDGQSLFNLTEANQLISTDHINETFTYYLTDAQANTGLASDQIPNFTAYPNPTPLNDVVYARIETTKGCHRTAQIDLVVSATQIPTAFNLSYEVCDDKLVDNKNTNGIASFDFSDAEQLIKDEFPGSGINLTVTFYTNEADALAETNAIPDISDHRNDTSPKVQQIYVRVDSNVVNACLGLGNHITLTVDPLPEVNTIQPYVLCSDSNETTFNLTSKDNEVRGGQTRPIIVSYHLSEQDAIDNIEIPTPTGYLSGSKTIYVRAQFDDNGNGILDGGECVNTDMSFNLVVNPNPVLTAPDDIRICNDQTDTTYDLTVRENQITNGDSSILLTYFETPLDVTNNTPIPTPETYINNQLDRDIIVLATGTNTCTSTTTLSLKTIIYANINKAPQPIEECEIDNNGIDFFDVTLRETEILNGLDPADFAPFTYYENQADAIAGNSSSIDTPGNFENTIEKNQTIYVRVRPIANECFIVVPLNLIVNPVPEIAIEDEYVICLNRNDEIINPVNLPFLSLPPIDTQLNTSEYTFQWYRGTEAEVNADPTGTAIIGATGSQYVPETVGNYTVFATNIATGCRIPASTVVLGSYPPESISVELLSTAFSDNNRIEVTVIGVGDYEYRLDSGSWQSSNVFERLTGGEHTVYVRDLLNCNEISEIQIVIDYPKYFTPNDDGVHDTWNIKGIANQPNAEIYIFDRYGKLLKQLSPRQIGWDGTFNGYKFPTGDYWFVVKYNEPGDDTEREFRSHFSLKR